MSKFKQYLHNTSGNFSAVMAIGTLAVAVVTGAAVETAYMAKTKDQLQAQLDMTALGVASAISMNREELNYSDLAHDLMVKNGYSLENEKPVVVQSGSHLDLTTTVNYSGVFSSLLGGKTTQLTVTSQSTLPAIGKMEIVFALDNTASMGYEGRIGSLKVAARKLLDDIEDGNSGSTVALVPFARYINIGNATGSWLDKPAEYDTERTWKQATHSCESYSYETVTETNDGVDYTYEKEICNGQTTTYKDKYRTVESRYEGCIGVNDEPNHLDPISASNRVIGLLNNVPKEVSGLSVDTKSYCPLEITPLTNNYAEIGDEINAMFPTDETYIPSGLLWAERLLDRTPVFSQSAKEDGVRQIVVLMSDGKNTTEIRSQQYFQDRLLAPPYINDYSYDPDRLVENTDADTLLLCDRMKAKGIEIYTISFKIGDAGGEELLRTCASSPTHNFDAASNQNLIDSFQRISESLSSEIRLTR